MSEKFTVGHDGHVHQEKDADTRLRWDHKNEEVTWLSTSPHGGYLPVDTLSYEDVGSSEALASKFPATRADMDDARKVSQTHKPKVKATPPPQM